MRAERATEPTPLPHSSTLLVARMVPELLALSLALLIAFDGLPHGFKMDPREFIQWAVMTEAVTLMFMATVVDIASRIARPPPWWIGLALCAGLLVLYPEVLQLILQAVRDGWWIALPFAWSIIERLRELWTLPAQPKIEKLRRRALTFGRLYTGLILAGTYVLTSFLEFLTIAPSGVQGGVVEGLAPWFLAVFFGLAAFDVWRVHRPAFAARPRNLWPRFDGEQTAYLDPL